MGARLGEFGSISKSRKERGCKAGEFGIVYIQVKKGEGCKVGELGRISTKRRERGCH